MMSLLQLPTVWPEQLGEVEWYLLSRESTLISSPNSAEFQCKAEECQDENNCVEKEQRQRPMLVGCPIHTGLSVFKAYCCDRKVRPGLINTAHVVGIRQTEPLIKAVVSRGEERVGAQVPARQRERGVEISRSYSLRNSHSCVDACQCLPLPDH